ncbi:hypothetical protein BMG00_13695 [Thioclava marina]|uniref:histidine kinase n=1 Tax=Thioclava marina TaxID=1915077 RepID=A0ABX3MKQ1_9RHOB|nr:HWE histidine kinase domain-containing protein [Thioclava marina]OOY12104.1 hypothetical protein BMG00_13695 [Thioclava marina]
MNVDLPEGESPQLSKVADPQRLNALRQTGLLEAAPVAAFQRATRLATKLIGAPVSLVSLIDENRQILAGQSGLSAPGDVPLLETPLSHSFCRYVVERDRSLIVPDARKDPELRDNGAVEDLGVISYLGVPLRTTEGHVLGSFCVLGHDPRDWTEEEHELVADIAAGVEAEIRLRRQHIISRREQEVFRAILDQMPVSVALAEVGTGRLVDVNSSARAVMGTQKPNSPFAPKLEIYASDGRRYETKDLPLSRAAVSGEVITAEEIRIERSDAAPRDLVVSARRIDSDPPLAVSTALDVTELNTARREAAESYKRLAHFHEVTRDGIVELDREDRVRFANSVLRKRFRDTVSETVASGLIGSVLWESAPHLRGSAFEAALERARATSEPQSTDQMGLDERVLEARIYPDGETMVVYLRDVTDERMMAQARDTLTRELNHRVKNAFAMMSGLIGMTARHAASPEAMAAGLRSRITALARAHELISPTATIERDFRGAADLGALIAVVLSPFVEATDSRLDIGGPEIVLNHSGATNLSLILHELATNAVKYGALSHDAGRLAVSWSLTPEGQLELRWEESGHPGVLSQPGHNGFGSRLIDLTVNGQLRGSYGTEWAPEGFRSCMTVPMDLIKG